MSATIDKIDNFEYYSKDIRTMIDNKYLCDYQLHVPIFNDDPTNKNICEHLLKNYRNVIIYCNSKNEGKIINKLMNNLQLKSAEYIDCNTPKRKRNTIIDNYKKGEIPFLINVRILVEGLDAPITKGVCFFHLPSNKTVLIQIIGRALRLHPTKMIANIILPFSSNEDEKSICNFIKIIAKNDSRIKKSYENKNLGGYITLEKIINEKNDEIEENNEIEENDKINNIEFKYNMVYNSFGFLKNKNEIWIKRLNDLKLYIDKHNKRPSRNDENSKKYEYWTDAQIKAYRLKNNIMSDEYIYTKWHEFITDKKYKKFFCSKEEKWYENLKETKEYMDTYKKRPSTTDKNNQIKLLGIWIIAQNYEKKNIFDNTERNNIMRNEEISKKWDEFNIQYAKYFMTYEDIWFENLKKTKQYIDIYNKRPSNKDKEDIQTKKLGSWVCTQVSKIKQKIIKNEEMLNKWNEFICDEKYKKYFITK